MARISAGIAFLSEKPYNRCMENLVFNKSEFVRALTRLGELVPPGTSITLAGGAALLLAGEIDRATSDGDVILSHPPLARIQTQIEQVAQEMELNTHWLNDGVKGYLEEVPSDFESRVHTEPVAGNLVIQRLGRLDLMTMKLCAGREQDMADLETMSPSAEEIAFLRKQSSRIGETNERAGYLMDLRLEVMVTMPSRDIHLANKTIRARGIGL